MTPKEEKSIITRISVGNWITILVVTAGLVFNYAFLGSQVEHNGIQIAENKLDIRQMRSEYIRIITMLENQGNDIDKMLEKFEKYDDSFFNLKKR